jgi:hypothetical protein
VAALAERQQLTAILLDEIEETAFPSTSLMDRVERLISTREELEDYLDLLLQKVERTIAPHRPLLDRIERLLSVLQRADQDARSQR